MKVFKNPQFKTTRGVNIVVEGGAPMNPLFIIESALGNVRATKELGGISFARTVKALGIKLCQLKQDAKEIIVEDDELKAIKSSLEQTIGSFAAQFEAACFDVVDAAEDFKEPAPKKKAASTRK